MGDYYKRLVQKKRSPRGHFSTIPNEKLITVENPRVDPDSGDLVLEDGSRGTVRLPNETLITPDWNLRDRAMKAFGNNEWLYWAILKDLYEYTEDKDYDETLKPSFKDNLSYTYDYQKNPANYELEKLIKLIEDAGYPNIVIQNDKSTAGESYYPETDYYRASHDNKTNTIYIGDPRVYTNWQNAAPGKVLKNFIAELAHANQFFGGDDQRRYGYYYQRNFLGNEPDEPISWKYGTYESGYEDPGNVEYSAHKFTEPGIYDYIRSNQSVEEFNKYMDYKKDSAQWENEITNYDGPVFPERGQEQANLVRKEYGMSPEKYIAFILRNRKKRK